MNFDRIFAPFSPTTYVQNGNNDYLPRQFRERNNINVLYGYNYPFSNFLRKFQEKISATGSLFLAVAGASPFERHLARDLKKSSQK